MNLQLDPQHWYLKSTWELEQNNPRNSQTTSTLFPWGTYSYLPRIYVITNVIKTLQFLLRKFTKTYKNHQQNQPLLLWSILACSACCLAISSLTTAWFFAILNSTRGWTLLVETLELLLAVLELVYNGCWRTTRCCRVADAFKFVFGHEDAPELGGKGHEMALKVKEGVTWSCLPSIWRVKRDEGWCSSSSRYCHYLYCYTMIL